MSGYQGPQVRPNLYTRPTGNPAGRMVRPTSDERFGDMYGEIGGAIDQGDADARAYFTRLAQLNRPMPRHSRVMFLRGY